MVPLAWAVYPLAFSCLAFRVVGSPRLPIFAFVLVVKPAGPCREDNIPRVSALLVPVAVRVEDTRTSDCVRRLVPIELFPGGIGGVEEGPLPASGRQRGVYGDDRVEHQRAVVGPFLGQLLRHQA